MEDKTNKIIEKIQKIINKAESSREKGNDQEADTFMAHANKLMVQYMITENMIDLEDKSSTPKIESIPVSLEDKNNGCKWRLALIRELLDFHMCTFYYRGGKQDQIQVFGSKDSVEIALFMYNNLTAQFLKSGNTNFKLSKENGFGMSKYHYMKTFLIGAAHGFIGKLEKEKNELAALPEAQGLIHLKKESVEKYMQDNTNFTGVKKVRPPSIIDREVYLKGYKVGGSTNTQKGIN